MCDSEKKWCKFATAFQYNTHRACTTLNLQCCADFKCDISLHFESHLIGSVAASPLVQFPQLFLFLQTCASLLSVVQSVSLGVSRVFVLDIFDEALLIAIYKKTLKYGNDEYTK